MRENETVNSFQAALALFGSRVHQVRDDQWDAPTPCAEWSVRDLVNHLAVEQMWVPPLVVDGATVGDLADRWAGDQLGGDPVATWDRVARESLAAFRSPGALDRTVHLSMGETPVAEYCSQMTMDATVHGWDLSRALGVDDGLPPDLVELSLRETEPYADDLAASGLFAPALPVPAGADDQTRLLARLGRGA